MTARLIRTWLGAESRAHPVRFPLVLLGAAATWGIATALMIVMMGWQIVTWVVPIDAPWHNQEHSAQTTPFSRPD
jgi:hypothetical protein